MIVNCNGLGNTLTDVGDDITSGSYTGILGTLVSGLANGDGWAYMLSVVLVLGGYRLYESVSRVSSRVKHKRSADAVTKGKITSLESEISGLRKKKR